MKKLNPVDANWGFMLQRDFGIEFDQLPNGSWVGHGFTAVDEDGERIPGISSDALLPRDPEKWESWGEMMYNSEDELWEDIS